MLTKDVKEKILKQIKPTTREKDELNKKIKNLIEILREKTEELGMNAEFFIGGSFGKGTFLKNDFDVDIFCRFDSIYKTYNLSELLKKILEYSKIKYTKLKGSRDYFSFKYSGLNIEVIPVLKINKPEDALNTTDLSPLHVDFVLKNTNEKVRDEIRLAKTFFKAKGLYGAESYIQGFSGHVIDLLIIYFNSLEKLIYNAKNWNEATIIDIKKFYKSKREILKTLDKNKINNLIVIDPIIKERNAASALSKENYFKFIFITQNTNILSEEDFEKERIKYSKHLKELLRWGKDNKLTPYGFELELETKESTLDIIGSKLLKLSNRLEKLFTELNFRVFRKEFYYDTEEERSFLLYFIENPELPKLKIVKGPKVLLKKASLDFIKKRKNVFLKEDTLYAYEKREIHNLKEVYISKEELEKIVSSNLNFIKKIKFID